MRKAMAMVMPTVIDLIVFVLAIAASKLLFLCGVWSRDRNRGHHFEPHVKGGKSSRKP